MRVCYFGTYREEYSRNRIMIESLRQAGVDVLECHYQLWTGIEDRVETVSGKWFSLGFLKRLIKAYFFLVRNYFQIPDHDLIVVGYPGQMDVFVARILAWINRRRLVLDVFMSLYLIAIERGLEKNNSISIRLLKSLEWLALRLPDGLIQDTQQYVNWLAKTYHLDPDVFRLVPTGADDRIFRYLPARPYDGSLQILYYGTFIPNHGVRYIIEAAKLLKDQPDIIFELVGSGPDYSMAESLIQEYQLHSTVKLSGWMTQVDLIEQVAQVDICLGAFGKTPQSLMTVQNKIYEGMALGRVVVTGNSDAIMDVFQDRVHLFTCDRSNPQSLAKLIRELKSNPELIMLTAQNGAAIFQNTYTIRHQGSRFYQHLDYFLRKA